MESVPLTSRSTTPQSCSEISDFVTPESWSAGKIEQFTPRIGYCSEDKISAKQKVSKRKLFPTTPECNRVLHSSSADSAKKRKSEEESQLLVSPQTRSPAPLTERQQLAYLLKATAQTAASPTSYVVSTKEEKFTKIKKKKQRKTHTNTVVQQRISKRNERGETMLHLSAIKGDCESVEKLVKAGANVDATDYAGWTALHEACNHGHVEVVRILLEAGANVNAGGLDNDTPLHDAVINNHAEVVKVLLKYGANPTLQNGCGQTPCLVVRSDKVYQILKQAQDSPDNMFSNISPSTDRAYVRGGNLHDQSLVNPSTPEVNIFLQNSATPESGPFSTDSSPQVDSCSLSSSPISPFYIQKPGTTLEFTRKDARSIINDILDCVDNASSNIRDMFATPTLEFITDEVKSKVDIKCIFSENQSNSESVPAKNAEHQSENSSVNEAVLEDSVYSRVGKKSENISSQNAQTGYESDTFKCPSLEQDLCNKEKQKAKPKPATRVSARLTSQSEDDPKELHLSHKKYKIIPNKTWQEEIKAERHDNREIPVHIPGYKGFMMSKKNYLLQSQIAKDETFDHLVPEDVPECMKGVFIKQTKELVEQQRQHQVEEERLELTYEQELIREASYDGCKSINKTQPFSVCCVLKYQSNNWGKSDSLVDRTSNVRSVQEKYQITKRDTKQRHQNELDSLNGMQRLEWKWKLHESNLDIKS